MVRERARATGPDEYKYDASNGCGRKIHQRWSAAVSRQLLSSTQAARDNGIIDDRSTLSCLERCSRVNGVFNE
jgi:hypothetical protein